MALLVVQMLMFVTVWDKDINSVLYAAANVS